MVVFGHNGGVVHQLGDAVMAKKISKKGKKLAAAKTLGTLTNLRSIR